MFQRAALALAGDRRRAHQHRDERREQQAQVHQRRGRPSECLQRESRRAVESRGGRGEPEGAEHRRVADQPAVADGVPQFLSDHRSASTPARPSECLRRGRSSPRPAARVEHDRRPRARRAGARHSMQLLACVRGHQHDASRGREGAQPLGQPLPAARRRGWRWARRARGSPDRSAARARNPSRCRMPPERSPTSDVACAARPASSSSAAHALARRAADVGIAAASCRRR